MSNKSYLLAKCFFCLLLFVAMTTTLTSLVFKKTLKLTLVVQRSSSSVGVNTVPSAEIKRLLRNAQAVCFDVDSTIIREEGIDKLAAFKGVGGQVADLTKRAMTGTVLFQDALADRLNIIKPSEKDMAEFLVENPFHLTDGIEELIDTLQEQGIKVYLVSGGFRQMIQPIAKKLHIPSHRIFANNILYTPEGEFKDFDHDEPTSKDGGKSAVIQNLKDAHGYDTVIMIGDGATDLQAKPPASAFIGYGGVIERDLVMEGADWFVRDFNGIVDIMNGNDVTVGESEGKQEAPQEAQRVEMQ